MSPAVMPSPYISHSSLSLGVPTWPSCMLTLTVISGVIQMYDPQETWEFRLFIGLPSVW